MVGGAWCVGWWVVVGERCVGGGWVVVVRGGWWVVGGGWWVVGPGPSPRYLNYLIYLIPGPN